MNLDPVSEWMVKQNLGYCRTEGLEVVLRRLHSQGYHRVAGVVSARYRRISSSIVPLDVVANEFK